MLIFSSKLRLEKSLSSVMRLFISFSIQIARSNASLGNNPYFSQTLNKISCVFLVCNVILKKAFRIDLTKGLTFWYVSFVMSGFFFQIPIGFLRKMLNKNI